MSFDRFDYGWKPPAGLPPLFIAPGTDDVDYPRAKVTASSGLNGCFEIGDRITFVDAGPSWWRPISRLRWLWSRWKRRKEPPRAFYVTRADGIGQVLEIEDRS